MADVRHRTTAGYWFRYLLRFVGIFAAFTAVFGLGFFFFSQELPEENVFGDLRTRFESGFTHPTINTIMLVAGGIALGITLVWLLLELLMGLILVTGGRAAVGGNLMLQIVLGSALFLVANALAFRNYARWDCTRDSQFTLPPELVAQLKTLSNQSPTDVVVLKLHKSAIGRSEERNYIDADAEMKIVEKVNDLVDQLRELGPRFRVTVLDRLDDRFSYQVDKLPAALRKAITGSPEDSIYFHANNRVRRMSFSDFYRVDKAASRVTEEVVTPDGKTESRMLTTNLVLLPQGREEFVKRLLSLEQRTPRIGLLTIHPELSTRENGDDYSSAGLRKSLEANGFEVTDIIIKKWGGRSGPVPAAFTYEEYELDRLESRVSQIRNSIMILSTRRESMTEVVKEVKSRPLADLDRIFGRQLRRSIAREEDRAFLLELITNDQATLDSAIDSLKADLAESEKKLVEAQKDEKASEGRRVSDVTAKLKSDIDECDLLIVPRLTSMDLAKDYLIRPSFYPMPKDQADAIKEYLKAGKPVLACFGPMKLGPGMEAEADDLERLFNRLGVEFGTQTVITKKEAGAAAERQGEGLGTASDLPPLLLDFKTEDEGKKPNPIRLAYQIAARAVEGKLEVRKSGPRIVTLMPFAAKKSPFAATILQTVKESWNEDRPRAEEDYVPKFEPTTVDDPKKNTSEEERSGPFSVGVAIETKVPAEWFDDKLEAAQSAAGIGAAAGGLGLAATTLLMDAEAFAAPGTLAERPTVRIVAFGHGGMFVGKELSPAQEQLLLHTVNWQLHRDDLLPRDVEPGKRWQFPRVPMSEQKKTLWKFVTLVGLPMLFAYLGIVVLMTRRRSANLSTKGSAPISPLGSGVGGEVPVPG